jgi:hypothetical protein
MSYRRPIRLVVLTLFILSLAAAQAAAWGPATHAYFADHAGKIWPSLNRLEMYGATLPDVCYFAFNIDQQACADVVHDRFMAMWEARYNLNATALGFGFTSHNEEWGADHTAHLKARTLPVNDGYVEAMANAYVIENWRYLAAAGVPWNRWHDAAHTLVEAAGDILVKRKDPFIGNKLLLAALLRGEFVTEQFLAVYGGPLVAEGLEPVDVAALEPTFRGAMMLYGAALMQGETAAIESLARQFAPVAVNWGLDPDTDPETLVQPIIFLIGRAITLIDGSFQCELRATTRFVRWNLWFRGVWY